MVVPPNYNRFKSITMEIQRSLNSEEEPSSRSETVPGGFHVTFEAQVVFWIIFGLLIGYVEKLVSKYTKIPYSPMLLVTGVFLSYFDGSLSLIGHVTELVLEINPHGILQIFIPTLIFESGLNMNFHVFKRNFWQIILLAYPGVVITAILNAFIFNYILNYRTDLPFSGAMTLGSITAATDPVSVVSLLKELGAPVSFNTVLEGESLLNDGTAMVFYLIFSEIFKGNSPSVGSSIWSFCTLSIGGPLIGVAFGLVAAQLIKLVGRDSLLAVNITFVSVYFCFFVAESLNWNTSSILALVAMGVTMSYMNKTR